MKISILTPSIQRQSLVQTCASIDGQSFSNWEHIVILDVEKRDEDLLHQIEHPQRIILQCPVPHRDNGNTCRYDAWPSATGDYCFYLDDDNVFADSLVLEDMAAALEAAGQPAWALFPILYSGRRFFTNPPSYAQVDTANVIVKRKFARWPNLQDYEADWYFIRGLLATQPYQAFSAFRPIVLYRNIPERPQ